VTVFLTGISGTTCAMVSASEEVQGISKQIEKMSRNFIKFLMVVNPFCIFS
jgi:hypothetical protein